MRLPMLLNASTRLRTLLLSLISSCLLSSVFVLSSSSSLVPLDSFVNIKNSPSARFVAFYHSSHSTFVTSTLPILERAAKKLKKSGAVPGFSFTRCDGNDPVNKEEFQSAGFDANNLYFFTSTPVEGIVKYSLPITVGDIVEYVKHKYAEFDEEDVLDWKSEEQFFELLDSPAAEQPSDLAVPIFLKFYETWCQHCQRLKQTFQQAATFFSPSSDTSSVALGGGVRFMEIQCSANAATTAFCARQQVKTYPVLQLWTGEKTVEYKEETRSIETFDMFFEQHVDGWKRRTGKEARRRRKKEKKPVSSKEEDDEPEVVEEKPKKKQPKKDEATTEAKLQTKSPSISSESPPAGSAISPSVSSLPDLSKLGKYVEPTSSAPSPPIQPGAVEARLSSVEDRLARVESLLAQLLKQ